MKKAVYFISHSKMNWFRRFIFLATIFSYGLTVCSQPELRDSLKQSLTYQENPRDRVKTLIYLGLSAPLGSHQRKYYLDWVQSYADSLDQPILCSMAWIAQGKALCFREQFDSANHYIQLASQSLTNEPDSLIWGELFITRYLIAKRQGKFIEALGYIDQAISYFEGPNHQITKKITALVHQGNLFNHLHRYSEARQSFIQAKVMAGKEKVLSYLPALYNGLGVSFLQQGIYSKALASFLTLLDITDKSQYSIQASAYGNLGLIYKELGQLDSARVYAEKTLALYQRLHLKAQQSDALINLALITRRQGDIAESESYLVQAESLLNSQDNPYRQGEILIQKGLNQQVLQNWDQAVTYFEGAATMLRQAQQHASEMIAYVHLAQVFLIQGKVENAIALCQRVEDSGLEIDEKSFMSCLQTKVKALSSQGQYKQALFYQTELIRHKDSLDQAKRNLISSSLLQDLAYKKQNQAFVNLQKQSHLKDEELTIQAAVVEKQRWQIGASLAAIFMGGVLLTLVWRNQQEKSKALKEQAKLSTKLGQQRDRLSQENQNKDLLLSILSHDLRAPLTLIKETLDMYEDQRLTLAESQELVSKLKSRVDATLLLTDNLLTWVSSQFEESHMTPGWHELPLLVKEALSPLEAPLNKKGLLVETNQVPPTQIWTDRDSIMIILRNLLNNAMKYAQPNGKIGFHVHISEEKSEEKVTFKVFDDGPGIRPDQFEKIFNWRSPSQPGSMNEKGYGLGLAISKTVVQQLGGRIWVQNQPKGGACFHVELPIAPPEEN